MLTHNSVQVFAAVVDDGVLRHPHLWHKGVGAHDVVQLRGPEAPVKSNDDLHAAIGQTGTSSSSSSSSSSRCSEEEGRVIWYQPLRHCL